MIARTTPEGAAALQSELEAARAERELAEIRRDLAAVRAEESVLNHAAAIVRGPSQAAEAFGDPVLPRPAFASAADALIDLPLAYQDGDYHPYWRSEQELAVIRGRMKDLGARSAMAINAVRTLANYVLGPTGFEYSVEPRPGVATPPGLAEAAGAVVDEFLDRSEYASRLQDELFFRLHVEGETFLEVAANEHGEARLRIHEPAWVTEPMDAGAVERHYGLPRLHWKYGVATDRNDHARVYGFFTHPYGHADQRYVPVTRMLHRRVNSPTGVKRGLSDLFAAEGWLSKADRTVSHSLDGAAVQAAIALIRKHEPKATPASLERGASRVDIRDLSAGPAGGASKPAELWTPGTIVDTRGVDYEAGPMGQVNGTRYVEIAEAGDRRFATRWAMPYHMVASDASNANYASTLVSEAPFTRHAQNLQGHEILADKRLLWIVLEIAGAAGRLVDRDGRRYSAGEARRLLAIRIVEPSIAVRDQASETASRLAELQAGVISLQTAIEESGRDADEELRRIEEQKARQQPASSPAGKRQPNPFWEAVTAAVESASACGANAKGGGGFTRGNTCGRRYLPGLLEPTTGPSPPPVPQWAGGSMERHAPGGVLTPERAAVHDQIVEQILGGHEPVEGEPQTFYMTGGGGAAGKSTLVKGGMVTLPAGPVIDSDAIKVMLPEWEEMTTSESEAKRRGAAAYLHDESSYVARRAMHEAATRGLSYTLDGVGDGGLDGLRRKIQAARDRGAKRVLATYATTDIAEALRRNEERAKKTGRYVPPTVIEAAHRSVAEVLPKAIEAGLFDEVSLYDTTGTPKLLASYAGGRLTVHDEQGYGRFLARAHGSERR